MEKTAGHNPKHLKTKQTDLTRKQTKQLTHEQIELQEGSIHIEINNKTNGDGFATNVTSDLQQTNPGK